MLRAVWIAKAHAIGLFVYCLGVAQRRQHCLIKCFICFKIFDVDTEMIDHW
jgi:hypothetical protein